MKLFNFRHQVQQFVVRYKENVMSKVRFTTVKVEERLVFPERFKGTIIEKWANYWKQLGIDYKDVVTGLAASARTNPIRASLYTLCGGSMYYCLKTNPNERDFYDQLRDHNQHLVLVHESCQNPTAAEHMKIIQQCCNKELLRYFSLGIFSVIWIDNYNESLGLYKTTCTYLKPEYLRYHERVIDIGFLGTWWNLKEKMKDYDVNF